MAEVEKRKSGSLAADLKMLLEMGDCADLLLRAGYCSLPVHRAVISARSPVCAAMFRYDTKEAREACVHIKDIKVKVLRRMLHFMYTDEVPPLDDVAAELLAAADKYQLTSLKESCEEWLANNINIEDAATLAVLALAHSCERLKEAVVSYMRTHYLQIIGTSGWEQAMRNQVNASVEICRLISVETTQRNRTIEKSVDRVPKCVQEKSSLAHDLGKLLESGQGADVTLVVSGSRLSAHRCVLSARSPVFAAMLDSDSDGILDVGDDTPEVLRQVLHFVYTDEVPCLSSMADSLFVAAVKYDLPVLRTVCEERLSTGLTIENAPTTVALAMSQVCPSLRQTVMNFTKDNFTRVLGTAGWARLLWDNPGATLAICQFVVDPSVESRTVFDGERVTSLKVALHDAARRGDTDKLRCVLAAGVAVDARDAHWWRTALHWASAAGRREAVRSLLRRGASVDAKDRRKRTPLHLAASHGDVTTVKLLLAAGADVNAKDNTGAIPLRFATRYQNTAARRVLIHAAANGIWNATQCVTSRVAS